MWVHLVLAKHTLMWVQCMTLPTADMTALRCMRTALLHTMQVALKGIAVLPHQACSAFQAYSDTTISQHLQSPEESLYA